MVFEYFYLVKYIAISFHKNSCGRVFNTKIENNLYCNQSLLSSKYVISRHHVLHWILWELPFEGQGDHSRIDVNVTVIPKIYTSGCQTKSTKPTKPLHEEISSFHCTPMLSLALGTSKPMSIDKRVHVKLAVIWGFTRDWNQLQFWGGGRGHMLSMRKYPVSTVHPYSHWHYEPVCQRLLTRE